MFNIFKIFKKKETEKYVTLIKHDFPIVIPHKIYVELETKGYTISLKLNNRTKLPSCIQLNKHIDGKTKYIGTLKSYIGVKEFKDGNVCNFHKSNLIME